jgi:uncharacterized protein (TIGR02145 family)
MITNPDTIGLSIKLIVCAGTVTDTDGNVYQTVKIGTQTWMVENLKTTRYNDGSAIPLVTDSKAWANLNLTMPGYCWYYNDSSNKNPYGALYNWYVVNTGKLAPKGWHVPSDSEWFALAKYFGGDSLAGGPLRDAGITHWNSPNTGAINSSGFSGLPGGYRFYTGTFNSIGIYGSWWSAVMIGSAYLLNNSTYFGYADIFPMGMYDYEYGYGCSVRCIRD